MSKKSRGEEALLRFAGMLDREIKSAVAEETHKFKARLTAKERELEQLREKVKGLEESNAAFFKKFEGRNEELERLQKLFKEIKASTEGVEAGEAGEEGGNG